MEIALAQRHLKRLHVEPVASENASVVAPLHVGGRAAAAGLRDVDHIVVNQCRRMDHFHYRAELNCRGPGLAREACAEQEQGRAETLAAALLQVAANGRHSLDGSQRFDVDCLLNKLQVFAHEIENLARGEGLALCRDNPFSSHRKPQCNGSVLADANRSFQS